MKYIINKPLIILFSISLLFFSCKKEELIEGCTDTSAMNYVATANSNDGSCIFAYDIAQGVWNIDPDCEDYTIPVIGTTISLNDQLPENIEVQGLGNNELYIEINETNVNATIDNVGNVIVPLQTISLDMGFGPMDIDVEGNGVVLSDINGSMNLTYSFAIDVIPGFPISESLDCTIILSK